MWILTDSLLNYIFFLNPLYLQIFFKGSKINNYVINQRFRFQNQIVWNYAKFLQKKKKKKEIMHKK